MLTLNLRFGVEFRRRNESVFGASDARDTRYRRPACRVYICRCGNTHATCYTHGICRALWCAEPHQTQQSRNGNYEHRAFFASAIRSEQLFEFYFSICFSYFRFHPCNQALKYGMEYSSTRLFHTELDLLADRAGRKRVESNANLMKRLSQYTQINPHSPIFSN